MGVVGVEDFVEETITPTTSVGLLTSSKCISSTMTSRIYVLCNQILDINVTTMYMQIKREIQGWKYQQICVKKSLHILKGSFIKQCENYANFSPVHKV